MVILSAMKTAISIPDPQFEAAEQLAARLGLSRSELYQKAISEFIAKYSDEKITEKLNEIYAEENVGAIERKTVTASGQIHPRGRLVMKRGEIWWAVLQKPDVRSRAIAAQC